VRNDHFISRFLTEPWEVGQRLLHFYDFQADSFGEISSKSLFAQQGLHTRETDLFMNKFVETPVSKYVQSLDPTTGPEQPDRKTARALMAFWALQSIRVGDAKFPGASGMTLDQFLAEGEPRIDAVEQVLLSTQEMVVVRTNQSLFFTETGTFPIPLRRCPLLIALPLTPHHFLAFTKRSNQPWRSSLEALLADRITLTALSVGVGPKVHRVVLLPETIPSGPKAEARVKEGLFGWRENCRKYLQIVGFENSLNGLDSWGLAKP
jgi:hypothetical protein